MVNVASNNADENLSFDLEWSTPGPSNCVGDQLRVSSGFWCVQPSILFKACTRFPPRRSSHRTESYCYHTVAPVVGCDTLASQALLPLIYPIYLSLPLGITLIVADISAPDAAFVRHFTAMYLSQG
jgi:hypothetical protein